MNSLNETLVPKWTLQEKEITIPAKFEAFSGSYVSLNGESTLSVEPSHFVKHAITSGLRFSGNDASLRGHKGLKISEQMKRWRVASCLGFIEPRKCGTEHKLFRNDAFKNLERTEKGQIDYAIGSMLSSLFVADSLNLPFMVHTSILEGLGELSFSKSRKRPDYVCFNQEGKVAMVEAKGRADEHNWNAVNKKLRKKEQMSSVQIRGSLIGVKVGCSTLVPETGCVKFYAVDPEIDATEFQFDPLRVLESYYNHLRAYSNDLSGEDLELSAQTSKQLTVFLHEENELLEGFKRGLDAAGGDDYKGVFDHLQRILPSLGIRQSQTVSDDPEKRREGRPNSNSDWEWLKSILGGINGVAEEIGIADNEQNIESSNLQKLEELIESFIEHSHRIQIVARVVVPPELSVPNADQSSEEEKWGRVEGWYHKAKGELMRKYGEDVVMPDLTLLVLSADTCDYTYPLIGEDL